MSPPYNEAARKLAYHTVRCTMLVSFYSPMTTALLYTRRTPNWTSRQAPPPSQNILVSFFRTFFVRLQLEFLQKPNKINSQAPPLILSRGLSTEVISEARQTERTIFYRMLLVWILSLGLQCGSSVWIPIRFLSGRFSNAITTILSGD